MKQVKIKIRQDADQDEAVKRLSVFPGVISIVPMLPGETDPELSRLYIAHLYVPKADNTLKELLEEPDVEYVEGESPRKLIR